MILQKSNLSDHFCDGILGDKICETSAGYCSNNAVEESSGGECKSQLARRKSKLKGLMGVKFRKAGQKHPWITVNFYRVVQTDEE